MEFSQALVTSVCQNPNMFRHISLVIFEELKVVFASMSKGSCHNFGGLLVGNQLRFLSVALLFAAVMPFLAFFGRSIGCSLTSTNPISKTVSLGWSTFLPERTRVFSTFWIVRQAVAWLTP